MKLKTKPKLKTQSKKQQEYNVPSSTEVIKIVQFYVRLYSSLNTMIDLESLCYDTMIKVLEKFSPKYQCSLKTFYNKNLLWAIKNEIRLYYKAHQNIVEKFLSCVENNQLDYLDYEKNNVEIQTQQYETKVILENVIKQQVCNIPEITFYDVVDVLLDVKTIKQVFPNIPKQTSSNKMKKIKTNIKTNLEEKYVWLTKN